MAAVNLSEVWIHDADNHPDFVRLIHGDLHVGSARHVERRIYAGGRVRMISTPNRTRVVSFLAAAITRPQLDKLDGWLGRLLMIRTPHGGEDDVGEVLWGFISDLPSDLRGAGFHSVPIEFQATTFSIEV